MFDKQRPSNAKNVYLSRNEFAFREHRLENCKGNKDLICKSKDYACLPSEIHVSSYKSPCCSKSTQISLSSSPQVDSSVKLFYQNVIQPLSKTDDLNTHNNVLLSSDSKPVNCDLKADCQERCSCYHKVKSDFSSFSANKSVDLSSSLHVTPDRLKMRVYKVDKRNFSVEVVYDQVAYYFKFEHLWDNTYGVEDCLVKLILLCNDGVEYLMAYWQSCLLTLEQLLDIFFLIRTRIAQLSNNQFLPDIKLNSVLQEDCLQLSYIKASFPDYLKRKIISRDDSDYPKRNLHINRVDRKYVHHNGLISTNNSSRSSNVRLIDQPKPNLTECSRVDYNYATCEASDKKPLHKSNVIYETDYLDSLNGCKPGTSCKLTTVQRNRLPVNYAPVHTVKSVNPDFTYDCSKSNCKYFSNCSTFKHRDLLSAKCHNIAYSNSSSVSRLSNNNNNASDKLSVFKKSLSDSSMYDVFSVSAPDIPQRLNVDSAVDGLDNNYFLTGSDARNFYKSKDLNSDTSSLVTGLIKQRLSFNVKPVSTFASIGAQSFDKQRLSVSGRFIKVDRSQSTVDSVSCGAESEPAASLSCFLLPLNKTDTVLGVNSSDFVSTSGSNDPLLSTFDKSSSSCDSGVVNTVSDDPLQINLTECSSTSVYVDTDNSVGNNYSEVSGSISKYKQLLSNDHLKNRSQFCSMFQNNIVTIGGRVTKRVSELEKQFDEALSDKVDGVCLNTPRSLVTG